MRLGPLNEFVESYLKGYMDGHREQLEQMEPEDMELELAKVEGHATGFYRTIKSLRERENDSGRTC